MTKYNTQCKTCPWKTSTDLDQIPNYRPELHQKLTCTIADGPVLSADPIRMMACHYTDLGNERPCAGWLHHQIGPGNNIGARLAVLSGRYLPPKVSGRQHERFEDTLPTVRSRSRRR